MNLFQQLKEWEHLDTEAFKARREGRPLVQCRSGKHEIDPKGTWRAADSSRCRNCYQERKKFSKARQRDKWRVEGKCNRCGGELDSLGSMCGECTIYRDTYEAFYRVRLRF